MYIIYTTLYIIVHLLCHILLLFNLHYLLSGKDVTMIDEVELQNSFVNPLHAGLKGTGVESVARTVYNSAEQCASLFSVTPIKVPSHYAEAVRMNRLVFVLLELVVAVAAPLVFRFTLGATDEAGDAWGSGMGAVEWFLLFVAFIDTLSWLLRGPPMVSGTPTHLDSSLPCVVEGGVALGCCTPIVSEDEAVFLRSLLGRTCTSLATCTSRHRLRGLYADTILNEKRSGGEEARRHMWFAWQHFVAVLVRTSKMRRKLESSAESSSCESTALQLPARTARTASSENGDLLRRMRLSSIFQAPSSRGDAPPNSQGQASDPLRDEDEDGAASVSSSK